MPPSSINLIALRVTLGGKDFGIYPDTPVAIAVRMESISSRTETTIMGTSGHCRRIEERLL